MAKVWLALGTKLLVDKTGGDDPTTEIARCSSIEVDPSVGSVETTVLRSTWKEYLPTLPDGGECTFDLQYDPTDNAAGGSHQFLNGLANVPRVLTWDLQYPTTPPSGEKFQAFLTGGPTRGATGAEEVLGGSVTLKITGPIESYVEEETP